MKTYFQPSDKLILALDGMSKHQAVELIKILPDLKWVKVGLELFTANGPDIINELHDLGLKVFLDLKFHDIPVTVESACREAAKTGAEMITIHISAGRDALKLASAVIREENKSFLKPPLLIGVTILTSWDSESFKNDLLIEQNLIERVKWLASIAVECDLNGCVCSPLEVELLRKSSPKNFELITPGVRLLDDSLGDQSRVLTPLESIKLGASKLVVGRPITKSNDPRAVFKQFIKEIENSY